MTESSYALGERVAELTRQRDEARADADRLAAELRQSTRIIDGEIVLPQAALLGQVELNIEALAAHAVHRAAT